VPDIRLNELPPARVKMALQGIAAASAAFVVLVVALGAISFRSDRHLIHEKIGAAIQDGAVQIPGRWDISDPRGIDTFGDCFILQSSELAPDGFLANLFDTRVFRLAIFRLGAVQRVHACDALKRFYPPVSSIAQFPTTSYSRYWWGSATLARIALGDTRLSVAQYRRLVFAALTFALVIFAGSFLYSFSPASLVFVPYLAPVCLGFSLLSLGQSISQSPEEVLGLIALSFCSLAHIDRRSLRTRAACYSFVGAVCAYLDLLDGIAVLVATIICCQWIASELLRMFRGAIRGNRFLSLPTNLGFLLLGAVFAILFRLAGYSYVSNKSFLAVLLEWKKDLAYRFTGNLASGVDVHVRASLVNVAAALREHRGDPFYGILSKHEADLFYAIGFLAWLLLLLCWTVLRKKKIRADCLYGFLTAGALIVCWFLILREHTVIHAWETGRLLTLFAGLGMSGALSMLALLKPAAMWLPESDPRRHLRAIITNWQKHGPLAHRPH
jgi:hypothetical protein